MNSTDSGTPIDISKNIKYCEIFEFQP